MISPVDARIVSRLTSLVRVIDLADAVLHLGDAAAAADLGMPTQQIGGLLAIRAVHLQGCRAVGGPQGIPRRVKGGVALETGTVDGVLEQEHGQQRVHVAFAGRGHAAVTQPRESQAGKPLRQPAHAGSDGQSVGLFSFDEAVQGDADAGRLLDIFLGRFEDLLGALGPRFDFRFERLSASTAASILSNSFCRTATTSAPRRFLTSSGEQAGFVPRAGGNSRILVRRIIGITRSRRSARSNSS